MRSGRRSLQLAAAIALMAGAAACNTGSVLAQQVSPPQQASEASQSPAEATPVAKPAAEVTDRAQPSRMPQTDAAPAHGSAAGAPPSSARTAGPPLPHELSPLKMFLAADIVVQFVMVALLLASVAAWSIWLAKVVELAARRRQLRAGLQLLGSAKSLSAAQGGALAGDRLLGRCIAAAREEIELSSTLPADGIKERVASRLAEIEGATVRAMRTGTGILASIGSTAPFVGLFGTVWGIMNSFIGISRAQTTNLAVVAPGIAEALLATAIGLVAAIPAVLFYNQITRSAAASRALLRDASARIERLVSRDLDVGAGRSTAAGRLKIAAE